MNRKKIVSQSENLSKLSDIMCKNRHGRKAALCQAVENLAADNTLSPADFNFALLEIKRRSSHKEGGEQKYYLRLFNIARQHNVLLEPVSVGFLMRAFSGNQELQNDLFSHLLKTAPPRDIFHIEEFFGCVEDDRRGGFFVMLSLSHMEGSKEKHSLFYNKHFFSDSHLMTQSHFDAHVLDPDFVSSMVNESNIPVFLTQLSKSLLSDVEKCHVLYGLLNSFLEKAPVDEKVNVRKRVVASLENPAFQGEIYEKLFDLIRECPLSGEVKPDAILAASLRGGNKIVGVHRLQSQALPLAMRCFFALYHPSNTGGIQEAQLFARH